MKKFFARQDKNLFIFENEELAHFNVLRCQIGEQILCLGSGDYDYLCEVESISKKQALAKIIKEIPNIKNPKKNITLFQGIVKGEKQDLIVQKITELGISNFYMFESEFCTAKANENKIDRLNKIVKEACKQCGRNKLVTIHSTIKFEQMLNIIEDYDIIIFANEKDTEYKFNNEILQDKQNIAIIVGSEGGFSDEEIKKLLNKKVCTVGLGSRILRAETASIVLCGIVSYLSKN